MVIVDLDSRAAGLLLHPTSLPGPFGAGDLGPKAFAFADCLHAAGLRWWQMLPITPPLPGPELSPYSSNSAFAGSPWLVSPQLLREQDLISRRDLDAARRPSGTRINFPGFRRSRAALLRKAFANVANLSLSDRGRLERFSGENKSWLDDWALYAAIRESQGGVSWLRWPADLRLRKPAAMEHARNALDGVIAFHKFVQWLFDWQWTSLKTYCNRLGIGLIGDIPIFVAHDSVDVWANRELFLLDGDGAPKFVSGYPADPFSPRGQFWGHPHYCWQAHVERHFAWWIARFGMMLKQFDAVRIDHFLGFHRVWAIPEGAKDAVRGKWMPVPGDRLFAAVRKHFGRMPIIAEDLGKQTAEALALRDKYKFPGMKLLQFSFSGKRYDPATIFPGKCVAYTGTHDNQTLVGWLQSLRASSDGELARALQYAGATSVDSYWDFIRALFASSARTVIVPVQDILGLGPEHRMNIPGVLRGNWGWRMPGAIPRPIIRRLRSLCVATGRAGIERKMSHEKPRIKVHLKRGRRRAASV